MLVSSYTPTKELAIKTVAQIAEVAILDTLNGEEVPENFVYSESEYELSKQMIGYFSELFTTYTNHGMSREEASQTAYSKTLAYFV